MSRLIPLFLLFNSLALSYAKVSKLGHNLNDFVVLNAEGEIFHSQSLKGGMSVVFFFSAAMGERSIQQIRGFQDYEEFFKEYGIKVYGISGDPPDNLYLFKEEYDINMTLLSDTSRLASSSFLVENYGDGKIVMPFRGHRLTLNRNATYAPTTFIVGGDGVVLYSEKNGKPEDAARSVVEFMRKYFK